MHILMVAVNSSFVYLLRKEILIQLIHDGHKVTVMCQVNSFREELEALGVRIIDVKTDRRGTNPFADLQLFRQYFSQLRKLRPDIILSNNIKPNIYGGLACRMLGIRYMPNITGLGTAVEFPGKLQMLTTRLYKWGIAGAECVFFQNSENEQFFRERNMLSRKSRTVLLPGSGVNLDIHQAKPYPTDETTHFLFIARLMKEKGIDLYLAAAKAIHEKYPNTLFHICGGCDDEKYLSIVRQAEKDGYIRYHGEQKDMPRFYEMAHCIVHPSYYPEGMSNVLLESAAAARPVIGTDRSGCREPIDHEKTGYIIPVKDEKALIEALDKFMLLSWEEKREMGIAGREKMKKEFDRQIVVKMVVDEVERMA